MFEQILELIEKYPRIIIHRHKNPDGDALGSQIGLAHMLRDTYPEKEVYAVGDMTPRYAFMTDIPMDEISDDLYEDALAIVLDTSAKSLICDERYTTAAATARIDHHIFVEIICDEEVTDTSFESCCGLVTALAIEGNFTVTPAAAKALYTGMITDSGRFRYDSTSSQTFRMAAFLMERKFETGDIYRNLYADELFFIQLRAKITLKIQTTPHRVAYVYNTAEEVASYGADTFTISRGMVNVMSEIRGIDTWVNFTETDAGVLCEIRSNKYNINPIAVKYGGGGHQKASGCTLKDQSEAMSLLSDLNALSEVEAHE
ncbi:MAG: bifunctional oligoribonuclease/PAP phosphatase NrnA [Ruminococcaceae bacterium]|nr:bifunctional oligoribonuclease/PAP phosphatase NrnA [Oscillospiraceae bacterium]